MLTLPIGRRLSGAWLPSAAIAIFLLHSANFLYFFVDDEAIPYVYAQNLLSGRGLSYNTIEPRAEGYSDFLHVCLSTTILAVVGALGLPKFAVFYAGKLISLGAGAAVLWVAWLILRRTAANRLATGSALGFLALSGPLAVWSASSLETVPFTLCCLLMMWALASGRHRAAAVATAATVLYRVDGFVFAGSIVTAFLLAGEGAERRAINRTVVLPVAVLLAVYHGWRFWYFEALLPAPLQAKVLYKLTPSAGRLVKAPETAYWLRFARTLGWLLTAAVVAGIGSAFRAPAIARRVALAATLLCVYAALVSDWMFGFRFFVPVVPLLALALAEGVGSLSRWRPRLAPVAVGVVLLCCAVDARSFYQAYREHEDRSSFLLGSSMEPARLFGRYYSAYQAAATLMGPGEVVSYNQAGFVPFVLDLTNIDTLGICSGFVAGLPVSDIFYTEVGKYAPLTNRRALRAQEAYLLYRNVRFIMSPTDLLRSANEGQVPSELMGGYYQLAATDRAGANAIYRRTERRFEASADPLTLFRENLAHVSNIERAAINGRELSRADIGPSLPFLRDKAALFDVRGVLHIDVRFSRRDPMVYELSIERVELSAPATVTMSLLTATGRLVRVEALRAVGPGAIPVSIPISSAVPASRLVIEISPIEAQTPLAARIVDLRVQGQSAALRKYLQEYFDR